MAQFIGGPYDGGEVEADEDIICIPIKRTERLAIYNLKSNGDYLFDHTVHQDDLKLAEE